jgi:hypothetical protein
MINLFTSYFKGDDIVRQKEFNYCLAKNKANISINRIIYFKHRPTYQDFFRATKDYPNDINILANADIYFNDTIQIANNINVNECYALTRWELHKGSIILFEDRHSGQAKARHSQDVWIFRGAVNRGNIGKFHLGIGGCDNRIAYQIHNAGYLISNPSLSIQTIHVHKDDFRKETNQSIPPPYKWIEQTRL